MIHTFNKNDIVKLKSLDEFEIDATKVHYIVPPLFSGYIEEQKKYLELFSNMEFRCIAYKHPFISIDISPFKLYPELAKLSSSFAIRFSLINKKSSIKIKDFLNDI